MEPALLGYIIRPHSTPGGADYRRVGAARSSASSAHWPRPRPGTRSLCRWPCGGFAFTHRQLFLAAESAGAIGRLMARPSAPPCPASARPAGASATPFHPLSASDAWRRAGLPVMPCLQPVSCVAGLSSRFPHGSEVGNSLLLLEPLDNLRLDETAFPHDDCSFRLGRFYITAREPTGRGPPAVTNFAGRGGALPSFCYP